MHQPAFLRTSDRCGALALLSIIGSLVVCPPSGAQSGSIPLPNPPAKPAEQGPPLAPPAKNRPQTTPTAADPEEQKVVLEVKVAFTETRPADAPTAATEGDRVAEQVGRLAYARIDIEVERAPMRDVLRALRKGLGLNLIVFEQRNENGTVTSGIDGAQPVDLALSDTDGLAVLEALAALAGSEVTWQVNRGTVEFGPKSVLARAEARRTEVVEVGDLALVPPDFKSCGIGALGVESYNRLDSDEVLADLVRAISTHCEPTAFEPDPERRHDATALGNRQILAGNAATPTKSRTRHNPNTNAWRNLDPAIGPVYVHGRWASLQTRDTALVIAGPDFVMRKVIGYPKPLPPRERGPATAATDQGKPANAPNKREPSTPAAPKSGG
jgi:hypothetical protein